MTTTTKSRLAGCAGLPDGINSQHGKLAGSDFDPILLLRRAHCQYNDREYREHCMAQVVFHLTRAEQWLNAAEAS